MTSHSNRRAVLKAIFFVLCCSMMAASRADELCTRQKLDPELPAGLDGKYEIIGRMPDSDVTYSGTLEVGIGKTAYTLKRTVNGNIANGEAWFETCGLDEIQVLSFKYTQGKKPMEGFCFINRNGDNYMLMSCYTNYVGVESKRSGLESMFQLSGS
jgi:hypothetical protein